MFVPSVELGFWPGDFDFLGSKKVRSSLSAALRRNVSISWRSRCQTPVLLVSRTCLPTMPAAITCEEKLSLATFRRKSRALDQYRRGDGSGGSAQTQFYRCEVENPLVGRYGNHRFFEGGLGCSFVEGVDGGFEHHKEVEQVEGIGAVIVLVKIENG